MAPFVNEHVHLDFVSDWMEIVLRRLESLGCSRIPGEVHLRTVALFETLRRRVDRRPRRVLLPAGFSVADNLREGFLALCAKFEAGADVAPHLSTLIHKATFHDGLLNDWGIHHLHLGVELEANGFVERSGPLLFAWVEPDVVRILAIGDHSSFVDDDLLEILHANWPEVTRDLVPPGFVGEGKPLAYPTIGMMRKAGLTVVTTLRDGTVLLPPGGGAMGSGHNSDSVRLANRLLNNLFSIEKAAAASYRQLMEACEQAGTPLSWPTRLRLRVRPNWDVDAVAFGADGGGYAIWAHIGNLMATDYPSV